MRLLRKLTNKEWKEISEKYKDGGVHMFRGKRTLFYKGEILWDRNDDDDEEGWPIIYDEEERNTWRVIIVLPGVTVIPFATFHSCDNVKVVIMSDTVETIERAAFDCCESLKIVRLSRSLEYIGRGAFYSCTALASIFIPPSCTEIGEEAFYNCERLVILGLPQHTELGRSLLQYTKLIKKSPLEIHYDGYYDRSDDNEEEAVQWVKSINNEDTYALHRACSSYNPLTEIIHDLVKRQGIKAMKMKNAIGITPSRYLRSNPFADISEKEIINRYISEMMGEVI